MELKGKFKISELEFRDCSILVENGIIHRVLVDNVRPMDYFGINPKENTGFNIYKLPSKKGLVPMESNYKLQYDNEQNIKNTIYLNLNTIKLFSINWQQKKFYFQKSENWIKIIIGIGVALILYYLKDLLFTKSI